MYEMIARWLGIDQLNGRVNAAPDESYALPAEVEVEDDIIDFDDQCDEPDLSDVFYYLEQGKKVEAIKAYRNATGVGLKEAKTFVDDLQQGYRDGSVVLEEVS